MKVKDLKKVFFVFVTAILLCVEGAAQSRPAVTMRTPDGDVIIPTPSGVLGQKDTTALTELSNHMAAVSSDHWIGMQGTGKITYGSQDSASYDATLSNLGADRFRLDAKTKGGETSIRIHHQMGKIQNDDGTSLLFPTEAAMAGIFPFELPRTSLMTAHSISLIDHGIVQIGSTELHRITFERPSVGRDPITKLPVTVAIDLYFDPSSHLLMKSVSSIPVVKSRMVNFLFVVTYGDYRKVGNTLVPFLYSETMEGKPYQILQLADVQLNPTLDSKYFEF